MRRGHVSAAEVSRSSSFSAAADRLSIVAVSSTVLPDASAESPVRQSRDHRTFGPELGRERTHDVSERRD